MSALLLHRGLHVMQRTAYKVFLMWTPAALDLNVAISVSLKAYRTEQNRVPIIHITTCFRQFFINVDFTFSSYVI